MIGSPIELVQPRHLPPPGCESGFDGGNKVKVMHHDRNPLIATAWVCFPQARRLVSSLAV